MLSEQYSVGSGRSQVSINIYNPVIIVVDFRMGKEFLIIVRDLVMSSADFRTRRQLQRIDTRLD